MLKQLISTLYLLFVIASVAISQEGPPDSGGPSGMDAMGPRGRGIGGIVTQISGSTVSIKTEEGGIYQIFTSSNTHLMKQREPIKVGEIHVGDALMAGGELDAKAKTVGAVFVAVLTPEEAQRARKMRDEFGKTWTAGEVTGINELTLTIRRRDNVTQAVTVDENTSFKKHRESVTLADIQVGDRVMAQGAVKNGTFVATSVSAGRMGPPGGEGRGGEGRERGGPAQPNQ